MNGFNHGPSSAGLGQTVQNLRHALDFDVRRLANRSGLSRETIEALELGRHEADLDTLVAIASGLGVRLWALMTMAEHDTGLSA